MLRKFNFQGSPNRYLFFAAQPQAIYPGELAAPAPACISFDGELGIWRLRRNGNSRYCGEYRTERRKSTAAPKHAEGLGGVPAQRQEGFLPARIPNVRIERLT
jgi:hypothetical protein